MAATKEQVRLTGRAGSDVRQLVKLVNRLLKYALNQVLTDGEAAIATDPTKARSTATINYLIDGIFKTKAATDNLWTLSGQVVPAGHSQLYILCLNTAGTASVLECTPIKSGTFTRPEIPDAVSAVASVQVVCDAVTTFTPGTTSLAAAGITDSYFDGPGKEWFPLLSDDTNAVVTE